MKLEHSSSSTKYERLPTSSALSSSSSSNGSESEYYARPTSSSSSYGTFIKRWLRRPRSLVRVLASLVAAALAVAICGLVWWLNSTLRSDLIAVQYTVCAAPSWYMFTRRPADAERYTNSELVNPGRRRDGPEGKASRVGMLQVCNVPVKRWSLDILISNHRQYAQKWDLPWHVESGIQRGAWSKIVALREWVERELQLDEEERLEWLLMSDVDTMMANPTVPIDALLPPPGKAAGASLIVAKDKNGLNAGVFFVRVNAESLALLDDILAYEHAFPPLHLAEQAALCLLVDKYSMESTGQIIFYPQGWINSYASAAALTGVNRAFILHWPSRHFKRTAMLPWLRSVRDGTLHAENEQTNWAAGREILLSEIQEFWSERD